MEEKQLKTTGFKSHILLPIIFVLTLTVAILFVASDAFMEGLDAFIIWLYFAVCVIYVCIALTDCFINKDKSQKQKNFIILMSILTIIAAILYVVFYLIAK